MQRLIQYIARCSFSLGRMIFLVKDRNFGFTSGYLASHADFRNRNSLSEIKEIEQGRSWCYP
ncbi:hypothetical protein CHISP_3627 [Chitinispirillum alkaliphilum]|nr:hypothetical protein CHISP_3627 [Chitinispirillum alkaliphilum]